MKIKGRKGRILEGNKGLIVSFFAAIMAIYQIYYVSIGMLDPWLFRAGHLGFGLVLIFLLTPANKKSPRNAFSILDAIFAIMSVIIVIYITLNLDALNMRAGVSPTTIDIFIAIATILLVLEASRRFFGPVLSIVAILFLVYAYFGRYIPGSFNVPPYTLKRIASYVFSTTGIFGTAIATSATYVYLFVLFGVFLVGTGVGDVFMDLAKGLTGGVRGGTAKVSVLSSALFGSVSGSASSNVVTTGAFTIPLMKKSGFKSSFAAAVETTASIGGLFLPPIMGAGGFLMADILQIPYREVVKAAAIPAILYYIVLFMLVDFEAQKLKLKKLSKEELPNFFNILKTKGYLLIPIFILLYALLIVKTSAIRAALLSIGASIVFSWFNADTRISPKKLFRLLSEGSVQALNIVGATACAGIIIGVVQMTGVGLTFSSMIMKIGGTSLILSLMLTMFVAIVLGMGLPITATYITASAILAPALIRLGVVPIAAHLFIYYFSAISGMTPPVCVTAFAAAGVSGDEPLSVGWQSVKLGWAAFVLPYMFVFGPELLMIGTVFGVAKAIVTALIGTYFIALGVHGIFGIDLIWYERIIGVLAGLLLINVGNFTNYIGLGLVALFFVVFFIRKSKISKVAVKEVDNV
ncbi:MAG: TRAP transporter permease [Gudongella sp.]|nr:TRAP transporter permease [Gudongella sp.]